MFFGVVDVPECDDEAIFGLDFELFDVETDAAGVVGCVADQGVFAAFGGFELVGAGFLVFKLVGFYCASSPSPLIALPCLFLVFPLLPPALLLLVEWAASIWVSECEAKKDVSEHQWDAGKG